MRTSPIFASAAVTMLAAAVPAQAVSMTVTVLQDLHIEVDDGVLAPDSHTIAAGQTLPSEFVLSVQAGAAMATWSHRVVTPDSGGTGLSMDVYALASGSARASSSGVFECRFQSPETVVGTLVLSNEVYPSGGDPGFGMFALDVDADGVVEIGAPPGLLGGIQLEQRVTCGPQGLVVRLDHQGSLTTGTIGVGEYRARTHLVFMPDAYRVEQGPDGCVQAGLWREATGSVHITAHEPQFFRPHIAVLLLGDQTTATVLPFAPGCLVLVDFFVTELHFLPSALDGVRLPSATMPPGAVLHVQAVYFDLTNDSVYTSQRLDLIGP